MGKRGAWDPSDLTKAVRLVLKCKYNVVDAARETGVGKATLYRKLATINKTGIRRGRKRTCQSKEKSSKVSRVPISIMPVAEQVLAKEVVQLCKEGFPMSPKVIKNLCFYFCQDNAMYPHLQELGTFNQFALDKWYLDFIQKNPEVKSACSLAKRQIKSPNSSDSDAGITHGRINPKPGRKRRKAKTLYTNKRRTKIGKFRN